MLIFTILKRNIYNTYIPTYLGFSYKKIIHPQKSIRKPIKSTVYKILKEKKDDKKDTKKNIKKDNFK